LNFNQGHDFDYFVGNFLVIMQEKTEIKTAIRGRFA
jgi:hypothetical protein